MSYEDRAASAKEIRDRRRVIVRVLEMLPPALVEKATRTTAGPGGSTVIRSHRGTLIASCADQTTAQFLSDAPDHLRAFSAYTEELEASAFYDRERRREAEATLEAITGHLLDAARLGMKSKEAQQKVQAAIREARSHDRSISSHTRPPNRQWRY